VGVQIVWIEIPVLNLERAQKFYETVFDFSHVEIRDEGARRVATLTRGEAGQPGFSLNQTANFTPSENGVLVYLMIDNAIEPVLARVEAAGGTIVTPKTSMGEAGNYALVRDTEGNVLAIYDYDEVS